MRTKPELIELLNPHDIDVLSYRKRGDKLYAELKSRHRIDGVWWEEVVKKYFPIANSTSGSTRTGLPNEKTEQFVMRLL